jgi:lipopolysaccharide biosynthesis glycosyltransferase
MAPEALARIEQEVAAELFKFKVHQRGFDNLMVFLNKRKNRANNAAAMKALEAFHEHVRAEMENFDNHVLNAVPSPSASDEEEQNEQSEIHEAETS